jgi:hypothetical protein
MDDRAGRALTLGGTICASDTSGRAPLAFARRGGHLVASLQSLKRGHVGRSLVIADHDSRSGKVGTMLWTVAIIFLLLWVLGLVTSVTLGGFIHVLIALAVVTILIRLIQGSGAKRA